MKIWKKRVVQVETELKKTMVLFGERADPTEADPTEAPNLFANLHSAQPFKEQKKKMKQEKKNTRNWQ